MNKKLALVAAIAAMGFNAAFAASNIDQSGYTLSSAADAIDFEVEVTSSGTFSDALYFNVATAGDLYAAAVSFSFGQKTNILGLSGSIFALNGTNPLFTFVGDNVTVAAPIAVGDYVLKMSGNAVGTSSTIKGRYMGSLTLDSVAAVQAVPEAQTYAMFLAGLGIMGAIVRRRS